MRIQGLLWRDNSDKPVVQKLQEAAARAEEKHGAASEVAQLHESDFQKLAQEMGSVEPWLEGMATTTANGLRVMATEMVLPGHFLVGWELREEGS